MRELAALQAGSFTTAAQATMSPSYAEVEAEIVRIWPDRDDGVWMYQEQAILAAGDKIYKKKTPLDGLSPDDLILGGCANQLERVADGYWRAHIATCPNTYRGATHMTSLSVYTSDTLANWDRGFDAAGNVVWGPEDGGYIFKRQSR